MEIPVKNFLRTAISGRRGVPQSRVMIRLQKPTPQWLVREFLRIRLTGAMLSGGEPVTDKHRRLAKSVGVVGIEIAPEWIPNLHDPNEENLVTQFCLVLDRRYRDVVLQAVYRTAGMLGDHLGIGIK